MSHRPSPTGFRRGIAAVVAVAAVALAACGSSSSSSTPAAVQTPSTAAAPSGGGAATVSAAPTSLGRVLVDATGMTLYHFDRDVNGKFACTGGCKTTWPPATVTGQPVAGPGVTGMLGVVTRPDGGQQLTYNNLPVYRYSGDQKAGDTHGDGVGGVWHATRVVAAAGGSAPSGGSPSTTPSSSSGYGY
jgi:predicted lipoprotein with Yx(FWY)xxD motif